MTREELIAAARKKPLPPYSLDEQLTFFCPQENVEGLELPVVREFLHWAADEYVPPAGAEPAVLLLLPCQKTKPYTLSEEHRAVNERLIGAGYLPTHEGDWPSELGEYAPSELLSNAPLVGNGLRIDRAVISEPFAFVPYEAIYRWRGGPTPCARYDDPGLFEERGIDPVWRDDCTAVGGAWGDNERAAYVEMHDRMAAQLRIVLERLQPRYAAIIGYVAQSLTHRTFLADASERASSRVPVGRRVGQQERRLTGVNDLAPGLVRIVPDGSELDGLREQFGGELPPDLLERSESLDLLAGTLEQVRADLPEPPGQLVE